MSARRWAAALACLLAWPAQAQEVMEYIHTDALGSVVSVTDQARNVLERRKYEPYGKQLAPLPVENGPGYTGHVQDALTGMVQMQQRYMDPGIGRFLSVDPVTAFAIPGVNFNRYAYAANNPYRFTDPDGRWIRDRDEGPAQGAFDCLGSFCDKYQGTSPWIAQFAAGESSTDETEGESTASAAVTVTGLAASNEQYGTVNGDMWKGKNGKWYSQSWGGNQWAGARSTAVNAAEGLKAFGSTFYAIGVGFSGAEFYAALQADDGAGMFDATVDAGFSTAATFGGIIGLGAASAYTAGNMAGTALIQIPAVHDHTVVPISNMLCSASGNC